MFLQWWRLLKLCTYSGGIYSNSVPTEITKILHYSGKLSYTH
jgi:hypothetical protein